MTQNNRVTRDRGPACEHPRQAINLQASQGIHHPRRHLSARMRRVAKSPLVFASQRRTAPNLARLSLLPHRVGEVRYRARPVWKKHTGMARLCLERCPTPAHLVTDNLSNLLLRLSCYACQCPPCYQLIIICLPLCYVYTHSLQDAAFLGMRVPVSIVRVKCVSTRSCQDRHLYLKKPT